MVILCLRVSAKIITMMTQQQPQQPPRGSDRRPLHLMVKGRVQSRTIFADLVDISEGGCKLRASSGFASEGDRVTIRINGINAPLGKVVWVEGKVAGVAFESAMHVAVLDHLCSSVETASFHDKLRMHRV